MIPCEVIELAHVRIHRAHQRLQLSARASRLVRSRPLIAYTAWHGLVQAACDYDGSDESDRRLCKAAHQYARSHDMDRKDDLAVAAFEYAHAASAPFRDVDREAAGNA